MADTSKKPLQGYYNQDGGYVVTEDELNNDTDAQKTGMTWSDAVQQAMDAYAPYKPVESEYVLPEPQQSDYVKDSDWFDTYFPTVSREDEQKRQKQYEQAQRWGLFGNALAAIGNAVGASQGLRPVQIYEPKAPDLQTWKNQLNSDRQRRATAEEQQKARFTTARQAQQTGKQQYARSLNQWQQLMLGAARTIYNAEKAKEKQASDQTFKKEYQEQGQKNLLELIDARTKGQIRVRQTPTSSGGSSSSGGRKASTSKDVTEADLDAAEKVLNSGKLTYEEKTKLGSASSAQTIRNLTKTYAHRYGIKLGGGGTASGSTGGNNGGSSTQKKHSRLIH